jgi:prophage regulatory protein
MVEDLLSRRQVMKVTTWGSTTLWRRVRDGSFPAPLKISAGRVAWPASDVEAWLMKLRRTDGRPREIVRLSMEGA